MKYPLLLVFLCMVFLANAQYTNIINSSRPGISETPYSVGSGVYQLETGYQFLNSDNSFYNSSAKNHTFNQFFRIGTNNEKLEYQIILAQIKNDVHHKTSTEKISDFSANVGLGFKYLLFERKMQEKPNEVISWKKRTAFDYTVFIPCIAISANYNFRAIPNNEVEEKTSNLGNAIASLANTNSTYQINALLQNSFTNRFVTVINVGYENRKYNNTTSGSFFNIVLSGSYYLGYKWSVFGEYQSKMNSALNMADLRTGGIYFIDKNSQLDFSFNGFPGSSYNNIGLSIGYSYRIDQHYNRVLRKKREEEINTKVFDNDSKFQKFFKNLATDFSIFTKNLFRKKENKIPKRKDQEKETGPAPPILN